MERTAILLFDGECGLCHRLARFIAARDRARRLKFAPLAGGYARELLAQSGLDPAGVAEVILVLSAGPAPRRLLRGARAALTALALLGPGWSMLGRGLLLLPAPLLAWGYWVVARRRYRWFGGADACALDPGLFAGRLAEPPAATKSQ